MQFPAKAGTRMVQLDNEYSPILVCRTEVDGRPVILLQHEDADCPIVLPIAVARRLALVLIDIGYQLARRSRAVPVTPWPPTARQN